MIQFLWILLRIKNISDKRHKNQNTFIFNKFFPKNNTVYVTMWKNMVQPDRPQMTI